MARYRCDRHGRVCVDWLHAFSAYHAIELLEEHARSIALIVSDHRMGGKSGTQLLQEVGERWPNMRRMLLTSWLDGDKASAPYDALSKDLDADYLIDRICKLSRNLP